MREPPECDATTSSASGGDRLRVATLNTLYYPQGDRWRERLPVAGRQLAQLGADVVGLQEVDRARNRDQDLASYAPERSYLILRASETQRDRYPRHWDGVVTLAAPATVDVAATRARRLTHLRIVQAIDLVTRRGRLVRFVNTHLHHPDGPPGFAVRRRQGAEILRFLDDIAGEGGSSDADILVGDLNAVPGEPVMALFEDAGFTLADRGARGELAMTFASGLVAPSITAGPPSMRIDYILVRGSAAILDAGLCFDDPSPDDPGLYPSDHLGLFADITI